MIVNCVCSKKIKVIPTIYRDITPQVCSKECLLTFLDKTNKPELNKNDLIYLGNIYDFSPKSDYEQRVFNFLRKHFSSVLYEPFSFRVRQTLYTPDFYIPEKNLLIEVKGFWDYYYKKIFNWALEKYKDNIILFDKQLIKRVFYERKESQN